MNEEDSLLKQLDVFNKIVADVENIQEEVKDEDKTLILLASLPKSYEHFKDAHTIWQKGHSYFGRSGISLEIKGSPEKWR